ncbi:MAG: hypothetical protein HZC41_20055 [Chloroflexi bacterium]|nr:hypothetical protein [Chloroflexota bacterium]
MRFQTQRLAGRRPELGLIIVSLLVALLHAGPLHGSRLALVLVVLGQLVLPGWLLARALGRGAHPHPIVRLAWVLAGGLGLTITLGGLCRVLWITVLVYILLLHGVMLALALLPPRPPAPEAPWRLTRRAAPLYALVALACVITFGVGLNGRYRFWGFEDQTIFISLADWLVTNPSQYPRDVPLRSRQIGLLNGDTRMDTDGWTYSHAAWSWSSGVSASDIIWYDLNPLLVWMAPLLVFALAYELTQREAAAAWSAAALVLAGLPTLDNIVYYPAYTAYGRFAVFQINSLRQMAITIMLPLAWLAAFAYLRTCRRRDLVLVLLTGTALAMLHPVVIMLFLLSTGATLVVRWLAQPGRDRLRRLLPLALALGLLLALPFLQRLNRAGLSAADSLVNERALQADTPTVSGYFQVVRGLPLVGNTFVREPSDFFYHPLIALSIVLGLAFIPVWRRSLAAQFIVPVTLLVLLLSFTPGLTAFYNRFASSVGLLLTVFILPLPLILGLSLDNALRWLAERAPAARSALQPVAAAVVGVTLLVLIFEPFPLPASARDQLEAYNLMQVERRVQPFQEALVASLRRVLPADRVSVLAVPYEVSSVVLDNVSGTLITGGRAASNTARLGDNRFFGRSSPPAPWLDAADLAFLHQFDVTHVVVTADSPRLPQLVMQPERFTLLDTPAGYFVFAVTPDITPDAIDALYERMNTLYGQNPPSRQDGFMPAFPGAAAAWQPVFAEWQALAEQQPEDHRIRLGLAFSALLAGEVDTAVTALDSLRLLYPNTPVLVDAMAYALAGRGDATAALPILLDTLDNDNPASRVLAARTLLTPDFAYLLNNEQVNQVLVVTETDRLAWQHLAVFDQPDAHRRRAALLMIAGHWATAEKWLAELPPVRLGAADVLAQAALALAQGDMPRALATLHPATDDGWLYPRVKLHPDRWEDNVAAQTYYLLSGDLALREGRANDAQAAYQRALDAGSAVAGRVFLARALEQAGQSDRAAALLADAEAAWRATHDTPLPELASLLAVAEGRSLYALQPQVERADEHHLTITALYSGILPRNTYPIQTARVAVISPDAATQYASAEAPAVFVDGALVRLPVMVELPPDIPPLTPALVYLQPRHSNAITASYAGVPITLNRPDSVEIPPGAITVDRRFGDAITLQAYTLDDRPDRLTLTLYWQTDAPLPEDYQVFVHLVNAAGDIVAQRDTAPVDGRYPTSQWRAGVTIADTHTLTFDALPGGYSVRVGLYRLGDFTRLPITPADDRVRDNALLLER